MRRILGLLFLWGPVVLIMSAIFVFSSIPSKEMPSFGFWDLLVKKGGHALGYGMLAIAFWHGFRWNRRLWWLAFLLAVAYAATDELHQSFVPGRHPSPADVGVDAAGALIMLSARVLVKKLRVSRSDQASRK